MVDIIYVAPLTTALTELVKRSFKVENSRILPAIALAIGIGLSFYFSIDKNWGEITFNGLIAALSAMGLWSGGKAIVGK